MLMRALGVVVGAHLLGGCGTEKILDGEAATIIVYGRVTATNGSVAPRSLISVAAHTPGVLRQPIDGFRHGVYQRGGRISRRLV